MKKSLITILLLAIFFTPIKSHSFPFKAPLVENGKEYVVILHGIARSKSHMQDLADYLSKNNYDVINLDYPSTDHDLEKLTKIIKKDISTKITQDKKVNFVGYSMGGVLVRVILGQQKYKNMGRVVQLAAPNGGSEVSDFVKDWWIYKKIYGPAGQQLTTDQQKIAKLLGKKVDYELGIIAGNFTIDPISSALIPGDDDGKVSIESTKLQGMKDHIVISASHTFFPSNKKVQLQTLNFLQNGEFNKN
ncbi:MAG: esterase/lipase [Rickettsiales bacterium]|jgi:esterase/lipase